MQATHGFAALSRSRTRLIGCSMAITLALAALVLALASPARAAEPPQKAYLGVGDSLTFDYSLEMFNEFYPKEQPKKFEEALSFGYGVTSAAIYEAANGLTLGYGEPTSGKPNGFVTDLQLGLAAKQTEESVWKKAINDGCPGETSDSLIGIGPLGKALEGIIAGSHGEAPCAYHNVDGFPLHNEYEPGQSQLENALQEIAANSVTKKGSRPVQLITFQIGSNDLLHSVAKCEAEVKAEFEATGTSIYGGPGPAEAVKGCLEAHAGELFQHILKNTAAALFAIRNGSLFGGVNYMGKIVVLGFYDPYGAVYTPGVELLPSSNTLEAILNFFDSKLTKEFGGCYANPQPTFNPLFLGKPALEPERLQAFTNMANTTTAVGGNKGKNGPDIHPTPLGYAELAKVIEAKCP
jgi:lysophospholipase L1-like esterase